MVRAWPGMTQRSTLKVKVIGQRSEIVILGLIVVLQVIIEGQGHMVQGQRSLGSKSRVPWVKFKGHFGQGQANA